MERWKPIASWSGYEVSDLGRVRSWKISRAQPKAPLPRVISAWRLGSGYACVTLKEPGRRENVYVHRAVAEAFLGPCPVGQQVAHGDGNPANNNLSNLRYATPKENCDDILRHGRRPRGARHYAAAIDAETAEQIRSADGTHAAVARMFGVKYGIAYCIRTGRTWRRA